MVKFAWCERGEWRAVARAGRGGRARPLRVCVQQDASLGNLICDYFLLVAWISYFYLENNRKAVRLKEHNVANLTHPGASPDQE